LGKEIARILLEWHSRFGRRFSFRETLDPYGVLVAEIMLRKTTARQVEKVWPEFMRRFPTIEALARANVREVEHLIASLGIKKRAHDLVTLAKKVVEQYGKIPHDPNQLKSLPGVGEYIANCLASFCFGERLPLIDSNVRRILCRMLGITEKGKKADMMIRKAYENIAPLSDYRSFHYALLDLAAIYCRPKKPRCEKCPVKNVCRSYNTSF